MHPGDCLLFHTDGVKEAVNAAGEEFGMDRLRDAFRECASLGAEATILPRGSREKITSPPERGFATRRTVPGGAPSPAVLDKAAFQSSARRSPQAWRVAKCDSLRRGDTFVVPGGVPANRQESPHSTSSAPSHHNSKVPQISATPGPIENPSQATRSGARLFKPHPLPNTPTSHPQDDSLLPFSSQKRPTHTSPGRSPGYQRGGNRVLNGRLMRGRPVT
jgi:hypothetical protein